MKTRPVLPTTALLCAFCCAAFLGACADKDTASEINEPPDCACSDTSACDVDWSYSGDTRPACWFCLSTCYAECAGQKQSPIDLVDAQDSTLPALAPRYQRASARADTSAGAHSVKVFIRSDALFVGTDRYQLEEFHFHTPSEHTIRSKRHAAEVHFVHANADAATAVVGLFIGQGDEDNPFMRTLMPYLPGQPRAGEAVSLDVKQLFPNALAYYTYGDSLEKSIDFLAHGGSLTTPPCTEGLRWIVLRDTVAFSKAQLDSLRSYFPEGTARPVQPLHGRAVFRSWTDG